MAESKASAKERRHNGVTFDFAAGEVLRDVRALDGGAAGGGVWAAVGVLGWASSVPVAEVGVSGAAEAGVHGRSL